MNVDVILGVNIDTPQWIEMLKRTKSELIIVIDYDYIGESEERRGTTFMSAKFAAEYIKNFNSVNYYKSLYIYPGMNGLKNSFF